MGVRDVPPPLTPPFVMNIRNYYVNEFPSDELGLEIDPKANFESLWLAIRGDMVYEYIGVSDSVIRERLFEKFSELTGHTYDYIYQEWLNA
jgi:hypothetical protein